MELLAEIARDADGEAQLAALAADCTAVAQWMAGEASLDDRLAGSVAFCTMFAVSVSGWQLLKQAQAISKGLAPELAATKPVTVRFFLDRIATEARGLMPSATAGASALYSLSTEQLTG